MSGEGIGLDEEQSGFHNHDLRAEESSVADLLAIWADLYNSYDSWPKACEALAANDRASETFKQAYPLLEKVFLYTNEREATLFSNIQRNRRQGLNSSDHAILIDGAGRIMLIGNKAEALLGLALGDLIEPRLMESLEGLFQTAETGRDGYELTEIIDKDQLHRLCSFRPSSLDGDDNNALLLTLHSVALPERVEDYLHQKLRITDAELEIIALAIQRFDIPQIAAARSNTVNTVRTHIGKITKKYGCRNFNDVITRTHELISFHETYRSFARDMEPTPAPKSHRAAVHMALSPHLGDIEYVRYGSGENKPMVVLHSVEYGYMPSPQFLQAAGQNGFDVYSPLRPGFGRSTPAKTVRDSAAMLAEFLERLRLNNVIVVALSTSSPTAVFLQQLSSRVETTLLVNYALDVSDKISQVRPPWLRGLLNLGLNSKESFNFAFRMTTRMFRTLGPAKFYKQIYKTCYADLAFFQNHQEEFEYSSNILFSANEDSVRQDFVSSFDPRFPVDWEQLRGTSIMCVHGDQTHGVPLGPAKERAEKYGFPFIVIEESGRNSIYHKPEQFFSALYAKQIGSVRRAG